MSLSISISLENILGLNPEIKKNTREKGVSLTSVPNEYTLVDIETTGLSPVYDSIIEVALIKIKDGQEIDRFNTLIKPPLSESYIDDNEIENFKETEIHTDGQGEKYVSYYVDSFITNLTGITNEMLGTAPSFDKLAPEIYDFIGNDILVGYNVNFDINFLYDNLRNSIDKKLCNNYLDLLRLARRVLPDLQDHKLETVKYFFQIQQQQEHRALGDCYLANEVLKELLLYVKNNSIDLHVLFKNSSSKLDLLKITGDETKFNPEHSFYKKYCVFTGKLDKMLRVDAAKIVADVGGICQNNVNKDTNFLILGNLDYVSTIKNGKSNKQKKAEKLILSGQDLQIINEDVFYEMFFEE